MTILIESNRQYDLLVALIDFINAGVPASVMRVYSVTMPATADTPISTQVLLGTWDVLADPGAGNVIELLAPGGSPLPSVFSVASGVTSFVRVENGEGQVCLDAPITAGAGFVVPGDILDPNVLHFELTMASSV